MKALSMRQTARLFDGSGKDVEATAYVVDGLSGGRFGFISDHGEEGWDLAIGETLEKSVVVQAGFSSADEALQFLQTAEKSGGYSGLGD